MPWTPCHKWDIHMGTSYGAHMAKSAVVTMGTTELVPMAVFARVVAFPRGGGSIFSCGNEEKRRTTENQKYAFTANRNYPVR